MIKTGSSFIVLYTRDIQKTVSFYTAIGGTITEQDEKKCVVKLGDLEMHFCIEEKVLEYHNIFINNPKNGAMFFYVETDNSEEMYSTVLAAGGNLKSSLATRPWNTREFYFLDPNGYNIVIYQELTPQSQQQ